MWAHLRDQRGWCTPSLFHPSVCRHNRKFGKLPALAFASVLGDDENAQLKSGFATSGVAQFWKKKSKDIDADSGSDEEDEEGPTWKPVDDGFGGTVWQRSSESTRHLVPDQSQPLTEATRREDVEEGIDANPKRVGIDEDGEDVFEEEEVLGRVKEQRRRMVKQAMRCIVTLRSS